MILHSILLHKSESEAIDKKLVYEKPILQTLKAKELIASGPCVSIESNNGISS